MKNLIWKVVLPLSVISFFSITKWWYAEVVDAPNTILHGYPLIFLCEGWHTSGALQIFLLEFFIDYGVYFSFWFIVFYWLNKFIKIKPIKIITNLLWAICCLVLMISVWIGTMSEHVYKIKRDFKIEVKSTGG